MTIARFSSLWRDRNIGSHVRQSGWSMVEYFAYPLIMFAATPVFLSLLGAAQYGQWMLLLTFNGLGGLAGLGMGTATIKEVSAARGRGDMESAVAAVRSCLSITLLSSLLLSTLLLMVGLVAGPNLLAKMGAPDQVRQIVIAAAFLIALEQIDTVFAGAIRGMERFDISARIEASAKLVMVAAALFAAWITHDLAAVIWVTVAITAIRALAKAIIAAHVLQTGPLWPRWEATAARTAFAFGKWTWVQSIGSAMFATADRMLVGSLMGATALAHYSICLQLAQQIQTVPAAGAQVLFPIISRRNEQNQGVRKVAFQSMAVLMLFAGLIALPIIIFSHQILTLWVGDVIADEAGKVLSWLALGFALLAINNVPHFVLLGLNKAQSVAWCNIAAGLLAVGISYVLIPTIGLQGAAWGRLGYAIVISLLIALMNRALRQSS